MNTYKHYLERWHQRFGEAQVGLFPFFEGGLRRPTSVNLLSGAEHDQKWQELLALWQQFSEAAGWGNQRECILKMRPIEVELLVWGRWFGPDTPKDSLAAERQALRAKRKGKR